MRWFFTEMAAAYGDIPQNVVKATKRAAVTAMISINHKWQDSRFKASTLRNVEVSCPYFHEGAAATPRPQPF